ncbi:MAG: DUF5961 family protein [Pseudomonadota bacterium]
MTTSDVAETQRYSVHAADEGRGRSHTVEGTSFEDAAFAFVERWAPAPDADGDVAVIVQDIESGARHCFRIDLGSGEAAPCD